MEVWYIDNRIWKPNHAGCGTRGGWNTDTQKKERDCMLILGITGMAVLLCTVLLYGCITAGKRSDREYRRLWEEYIAVHQKEEEKEKWEDQE